MGLVFIFLPFVRALRGQGRLEAIGDKGLILPAPKTAGLPAQRTGVSVGDIKRRFLKGTSRNLICVAMRRCSQEISPYISDICCVDISRSRLASYMDPTPFASTPFADR